MKILFDCAQLGSQMYGVSYAVIEQVKALQKLKVQVKNIVIGWRNIQDHQALMNKFNIPTQLIKLPKKLQFLLNIQHLVKDYDYFYQIGLHANYYMPYQKYLVAMHDVVSLRYPEQEAPLATYTAGLLKKAHKVITVSEFSKQEIMHFFNLPADRIAVIPNGCNFARFNRKRNLSAFKKVQKQYQLPHTYYLTYGGNAPRKNIQKLCAVFQTQHTDKTLVVIGGYKTTTTSPNILNLGYVNELTLTTILKHAFAFIMPSYYEGFGLPVLEAFACGVPVACANASSLPEVAGGHAILFNPHDARDIARAIRVLEKNKVLRLNNIRQGLRWVKNFSWKKSAQKFLQTLA